MKTGICLITKDCNPDYLKEWVEWHKLIGFDYFFIYDNGCAISVSKILKKYDGVFVFSIKGRVQQLNAYNDCLAKHKQKQIPVCDWIAFIDDDEFIIPEDGDIKSFLKTVKSSGVVFNWRCFGASKEGFSGTQIEKYINSTPDTFPPNRHVKSAVRPNMVKSFPNPHYALYIKGGAETVLGEKLPKNHPLTDYAVFQKVWINHYYCKSEKEWKQKQQRGRVDSIKYKYTKKQYNEINDNATEVNNYAIHLQKTLISKKTNENSVIALITPTGARAKQIQLCAQWMKAQTYTGDVLWVIVDDAKQKTTDFINNDFRERWIIEKVYPVPHWKKGQNTQKRNLLAAVQEIKNYGDIDYVFIIEDDDYYSPQYLETMLQRVKGYAASAQTKTIYVHMPDFASKQFSNTKHGSLFETVFSIDVLNVFENTLKKGSEKFIDIYFWKNLLGNSKFTVNLFDEEKRLAVGIKGMGGRDGIGSGHDMLVRKQQLTRIERIMQFKNLIGIDYLEYL